MGKRKYKRSWRNSYEWKKAKKICREEHPYCDICGEEDRLEVHHIQDASYHPDLRYDQSNLVTLCHKCHFTVLHILFKGSTKKKTVKNDYRRVKAIAKIYMKKE